MPSQEKFDTIYREYYPKAFRLCMGYASGSEEWARETAQEVFITVWEKLSQLKDPKALPAWIYRISLNTCMRRLKEKRKQALKIEEVPETSYSPEEQSEANEMLQKVYRAVDKLRIEEKNIALLLLEGVDNEGMAEILGVTRSHLRVKIHRVREKLKKWMENERV